MSEQVTRPLPQVSVVEFVAMMALMIALATLPRRPQGTAEEEQKRQGGAGEGADRFHFLRLPQLIFAAGKRALRFATRGHIDADRQPTRAPEAPGAGAAIRSCRMPACRWAARAAPERLIIGYGKISPA